jgi:hypothetical protein
MQALLLFSTLFLLGAAGSAAQSDLDGDRQEPKVLEVYLAKADPEGLAGEPATEFISTDIPIFCVVRLVSVGVATVKMELVAANVAGVRPETKIVSSSYTTREDEDRVNFTGRPHGRWVPGRYRADVYVNGVLEKKIEFEVKRAPAPAATSASPPLTRTAPSRQRRRSPK